MAIKNQCQLLADSTGPESCRIVIRFLCDLVDLPDGYRCRYQIRSRRKRCRFSHGDYCMSLEAKADLLERLIQHANTKMKALQKQLDQKDDAAV